MHLLCYSESAKTSFVISEVKHQTEDQSCVMRKRLQVDSAHAKCVLLNEDCSFTSVCVCYMGKSVATSFVEKFSPPRMPM